MASLWHVPVANITTLSFGAMIKENKSYLITSTVIPPEWI